MKVRNLLIMVMTLGLLLASGGCIFSPGEDGPPDTPPAPALPKAITPAQLMDNFRTIYEAMDFENFRDTLMDEDYRTFLQADTVQQYGLPESFFTYDEEIAIQRNIFSGAPIDTPSGPVPGVSAITFTTYERQSAWTTAPANDPNFPNALYASYNVKFEFERAGATTLIVQGIIKFYLTEALDGEVTIYKLIGQVDETQS